MPTMTQALQQAVRNEAKFKNSLEQAFGQIENNMHQALREVGKLAVAHSIATHEYGNVSGALERSHGFVVAGSGETVDAEYNTPSGRESFQVTSPRGEITLYLYAGMYYAPFVEFKGFSVLINTFLMLRREGARLLGERLRANKISGVRNS